MPAELELKLKKRAKKLHLNPEHTGAYVYGTLRKTGWKPKRQRVNESLESIPAPIAKRIIEKTHKTIEKIEELWEKSSEIVSTQFDPSDRQFYPMMIYLTERMAGIRESNFKTFAEYMKFDTLLEQEVTQIFAGYSIAPSIESKDNILLVKQDQLFANILRAGLVAKQLVQEDEKTLHLELSESTSLTEPQVKELLANEIIEFVEEGKEKNKTPDFSLFFDVKKFKDDITNTKFTIKALKNFKFAVCTTNFNRIQTN
jgi:hypothetical protein